MAKAMQMVFAHGVVTTREIDVPEVSRSGFKVGDRVRAKSAIIDDSETLCDGILVCAKPGDIGTVLSIVDEDYLDVGWDEYPCGTLDSEVEAVLAC